MIADIKVDKLEEMVVRPPAKPDQRRRWTLKVIERMRVAERAARILITDKQFLRYQDESEAALEVWHDAQQKAISQLRKEGLIR